MAYGMTAQADGRRGRARGYHQYLKKQKAKVERRRAKKDPECVPMYGKYLGWET
jgi:hypothetical protein